MAETLSLTHHHSPPPLDTTSSQSCEVCGRWERQFALQASELATLKEQLADRDHHLSRLGQDMQQLNTKYVSAIDRVADIQHEKDLVEHDLEELSCKLFEEANEMVAFEKREKWLLETHLQSVKQQLTDERAQLTELRQRLLQWDSDEQRRRQRVKKSSKRSVSRHQRPLITTTLKEEDEDDQMDHDKDADADDDDNDDDDDDDNGNDNDDDDDDKDDDQDDSEDETWQDTLEDQRNMDDYQIRAQQDLALLHGVQRTQQHQQPDHKTHSIISDITGNTKKTKKQQARSVSMPPPPSTRHAISPTIDQVQLEAFQQFVHAASTVPLKKLYQFAYMKYCQLEDVEPCLRFGAHSRLSVKKMMDYLLQQPCYIQQMAHEPTTAVSQPPMTTVIPSSVAQRPQLWDRWSKSTSTNETIPSSKKTQAVAIGCAACGRSRHPTLDTYYQFKMDEKDDWLPMDQYCRDRLVAVCEFFVFIRNIHLRLYANRAIDDLYTENIRLRLQMFYSR